MVYNKYFLLLVISSSFFGILISILNNDIIRESDTNITNDDIGRLIPKDNNNDDEKKNKIIHDNDYFNEDKDKENNTNKNKDNEKDKKESDENDEKKEQKLRKKDKDNDDDNKKKNNDNENKAINNEKKKNDNEKKNNDNEKKNNYNDNNNNNNKNNIGSNDNKNKEPKKKEGYNTIHLGINIDNKYIYPCLVFLTSLLSNRAPTTAFDIHFLTTQNLNPDYKKKVDSLVEKYGKDILKITYYDMKDDFRGAITGTHISTAAYYRIALPSLVPHLDKIIYTDTDVIAFGDLTEMFNLELKDKSYFMGSLDQIGLLHELKLLGIITKKYMNSGIVIMNLKSMRRDGIEQKIRQFINTHYLDHHDQTAINGVCYNNFDILSIKYATFVYPNFEKLVQFNKNQDKLYRYNNEELMKAFYEPLLLHYAGWVKPWDKGYSKLYGEYWWYYAKQSGFYQEILDRYRFDNDYVEKLINKIPKDGGLLTKHKKK